MVVQELNKETFEQKVAVVESFPEGWIFKGDKPCIVDFYTSWCSYCRSLAIILDQLADEYDGVVNVYKVNIEENEIFEKVFHIQMVPQLLFCFSNKTPYMELGTMNKNKIKQIIDSNLFG